MDEYTVHRGRSVYRQSETVKAEQATFEHFAFWGYLDIHLQKTIQIQISSVQ